MGEMPQQSRQGPRRKGERQAHAGHPAHATRIPLQGHLHLRQLVSTTGSDSATFAFIPVPPVCPSSLRRGSQESKFVVKGRLELNAAEQKLLKELRDRSAARAED
jgi:hypothetical protein